MAWFNSKTGEIVRAPPRDSREHPGWEVLDCGCCGGIQWGGESPRKCEVCKGNGYYCHHKPSGALAAYPGGPFIGWTTCMTFQPDTRRGR